MHMYNSECDFSLSFLRVSCKGRYTVKPLYNELTLCVLWYGVFFNTRCSYPVLY